MEIRNSRQFYEIVIKGMADNADVVAYAEACIKKMDEKNEKRSSKPTKAQEFYLANRDIILEALPTSAHTVKEIRESNPEVFSDMTTQRLSYILKKLVSEGAVIQVNNGEKKPFSYFRYEEVNEVEA